MNIGIFGGSFDPVHLGHLLLAEQCLEAAELDQILFVPAAIPPHKQDIKLTRSENRLDMLRLAIGGNDRFSIDTCELDREGISFTVDTLKHYKQQSPGKNLFLLIGADSLDEFHTWKDPKEICDLATPLVVSRPGSDPIDYEKLAPFTTASTLQRAKSISFQSRQVEISSTEIRARIGAGKSIRYLTPRAVEQYILEKKLYLDS